MRKRFKKTKAVYVSKTEPKPIIWGQPILIRVINESNEIKEYELFNASRNFPKTENKEGVKIESVFDKIDYIDILVESMINPINVGKTIILSKNQKIDLIISNREVNGNSSETPFIFMLDPYQQQTTILANKEKFTIDAFTKITGKINPNSELTFQFYPIK